MSYFIVPCKKLCFEDHATESINNYLENKGIKLTDSKVLKIRDEVLSRLKSGKY